MRRIPNQRVRAIGEAMLELAPVGDGLYRRGFAGDTFNTAWHMAQMLGTGADVGLVTRLGQDGLSDIFAAEMAADGLALSGVSRDPARIMGLYLIELDGAERSFHYWRDTSAARRLADDPAVLSQALEGAGLVHLSGITLAILEEGARETLFSSLALARAAGTVVSFDPNIRPRLWPSSSAMQATINRMLGLTDIALPSLDDEATHFGDTDASATLARMAAAGVAEVVVKDGPGPVHVLVDGAVQILPTPPASDLRDTTGAGDAFNAGYLAARVLGLDAARSVRAGQRLAAAVLATFGARASKAAVAALPPIAGLS
ncbi:MAG: sugar kinase [Rhodobacterales bacterium]|nr:sugar kinase [Rhodobacterales bacterium]